MRSIIGLKMYNPAKSTYDYMSEMHRLFPRAMDNAQNPGLYSPFQQSTPANQSSSSADSISPESFPDMSHHYNTDRRTFETPFIGRRQRPIVGRKIFDDPERLQPTLAPIPKPLKHEVEFPSTIWQSDDQTLFPQTPPNINLEQKSYTRNIYELFPTEKKGFEFKTSTTTPPLRQLSEPMSPISNYTPTTPNFSPTLSSASPISAKVCPPCTPPFRYPSQLDFGASSSRHQDVRPSEMCTFCRKNGETPVVYMTHAVKKNVGSRSIVTCPILRSHVCSTCGATGDEAHTISYCPVLRSRNNGQRLQSTTITLKNTRVKSNGRRRF